MTVLYIVSIPLDKLLPVVADGSEVRNFSYPVVIENLPLINYCQSGITQLSLK